MKCEVCEKTIVDGDEITVEADKAISRQDTVVCSVKCAKAATKTDPEKPKATKPEAKPRRRRTGDFVLMEAVKVPASWTDDLRCAAGEYIYVPRQAGTTKTAAWKAGVKAAQPGTFQVYRAHGEARTLGEQRRFGFVE